MTKSGAPIAVIAIDQIKLDSGTKPEDLATEPPDLNLVISQARLEEAKWCVRKYLVQEATQGTKDERESARNSLKSQPSKNL